MRLFGGRDLVQWRGFQTQEVPDGWGVVSGAIYCRGRLGAPDLITRETFGIRLGFHHLIASGTDTPASPRNR